jgi:hypothetical protein
VFVLSGSFGQIELTRLAAEPDAGFDPLVLADMVDLLTRYTDRDLSLGGIDPSAPRDFFTNWAAEIRTQPSWVVSTPASRTPRS